MFHDALIHLEAIALDATQSPLIVQYVWDTLCMAHYIVYTSFHTYPCVDEHLH